MKTRRKFGSDFKTKVVLETLSERKTVAELTKKFSILPTQIGTWKKHFLSNCSMVFESGESRSDGEKDEELQRLYEKIGKQQVELDYLKKTSRSLRI